MAGAAGGKEDVTYIDDVFSTYIYKGDGSTNHFIPNGLDLSGDGGMVWIKRMDNGNGGLIFDTVRGGNYYTVEHTSGPGSDASTTFNSNGFTIGNNWGGINDSGSAKYVSWSFKKAEKFFDIVQYTGNGSNRTISHSLGSVPGAILITTATAAGNGNYMYHRGNHATTPARYYLELGDNENAVLDDSLWNQTDPTDSVFSLGSSGKVNTSGTSYMAYIFAHDTGDNSLIQCGAYTGDGSTNNQIALEWEPQFLIQKAASGTDHWGRWDTMRGLGGFGCTAQDLRIASSQDESEYSSMQVWQKGFRIVSNNAQFNASPDRYVYIAIRRPDGVVGKPITVGTKCFNIDWSSDSTIPNYDSDFPVDMYFAKKPASTSHWHLANRLVIGNSSGAVLFPSHCNGQTQDSYKTDFRSMVGCADSQHTTFLAYMFKRHAGFDIVTYRGTTTAGTQITHGLFAEPEMIWIKRRYGANQCWVVGHKDMASSNPWDYYLGFDTNDVTDAVGMFNDTAPTKTHFTVGNDNRVNGGSDDLIAFLFKSVEGISKVGTYTGTSGTTTVTTGFQPRFVLIRYLGGENWRILDTTRGWGSGNDKQIRFSSNLAESSVDWGAPTSTGFTLTASTDTAYNKNGGGYIYYAHA